MVLQILLLLSTIVLYLLPYIVSTGTHDDDADSMYHPRGGGDGAVDRGMEYILSLYGVYTVSIVYWTRRLYIGDWKSI